MRYYILFMFCPKSLTPKSMHDYIYLFPLHDLKTTACSVCEIGSGHVRVMSRILQQTRLGDVAPSTCRETDAVMGKCKFADSWLEKGEFKQWLKHAAENNREAQCIYCKKKISIASMCIHDVKSHMRGASHKALIGIYIIHQVVSPSCHVVLVVQVALVNRWVLLFVN